MKAHEGGEQPIKWHSKNAIFKKTKKEKKKKEKKRKDRNMDNNKIKYNILSIRVKYSYTYFLSIICTLRYLNYFLKYFTELHFRFPYRL